MLRYFFEWLASKSNPRFTAYRKARLLYESYIQNFRVQFDELTSDHYKQAANNPQLLEAEQLYRQAIELSLKSNALNDVATGYYQLGMLLHLSGKLEDASESFQNSLKILDNLPWPETATISGCHYHLGIIAWRHGFMKTAKQHLETSLKIDRDNNDVQGICLDELALSKVNILNDYDKPE